MTPQLCCVPPIWGYRAAPKSTGGIYIFIYDTLYIFIHICTCEPYDARCICIYIYVYVYISYQYDARCVCVCVCVCVCLCVCVCVCVCVPYDTRCTHETSNEETYNKKNCTATHSTTSQHTAAHRNTLQLMHCGEYRYCASRLRR